MPPQICDKCYKAAAVLIPLQLGSGAAAKCCPDCFRRIYGEEELKEALAALERKEPEK